MQSIQALYSLVNLHRRFRSRNPQAVELARMFLIHCEMYGLPLATAAQNESRCLFSVQQCLVARLMFESHEAMQAPNCGQEKKSAGRLSSF